MLSVFISIVSMRRIDVILMSTHNILFHDKWKNFLGTRNRLRISHGKRAIGVQFIDVLLYFHDDHRRIPNKADETQARLSFQRLTS